MPDNFKLLLAYHGFNNVYSMSQLVVENLDEIELDARTRFDSEEAKTYLGHQASKPQTFKILTGFRKSILGAAVLCQKKTFLGADISSKSKGTRAPAKPKSSDKGLDKEVEPVRRLLTSGVKAVASQICEEAVNQIEDVGVAVRLDGGLLRADVTCHLCSKLVSILKTNRNTWVVSNFTTHMRKVHPNATASQARKNAKVAGKTAKRPLTSSPLFKAFTTTKRKIIPEDHGMPL